VDNPAAVDLLSGANLATGKTGTEVEKGGACQRAIRNNLERDEFFNGRFQLGERG
jgi:hypothetical protein